MLNNIILFSEHFVNLIQHIIANKQRSENKFVEFFLTSTVCVCVCVCVSVCVCVCACVRACSCLRV